MKLQFLPLLFLVFLSPAQVIPFKGCSEPECSQERYFAIMAEVEAQIYAQYGFEYNDSLSFDFKLDDGGELSLLKSYAWINEDAISVYAKALKEQINTAEMEAGQDFSLNYRQDFSPEELSAPELSLSSPHPEARECRKFNEAAQLACAKYFISYELDQALDFDTFKDDLSADLFYQYGKLSRVNISRAPLVNKRLIDALQQFPLFDDQNFKKKSLEKSGEFIYHYKHIGLTDSAQAPSYFDQRYGEYIRSENWSQLRRAIDPTRATPLIDTLLQLHFYNEFLLRYLEEQLSAGNIPQRMWTTERYPQADNSSSDEKATSLSKEQSAELEKVPVFKDCNPEWSNEVLKTCFEYQMVKYISESYNYPRKAIFLGLEGKVYVYFVVEKTGELSGIEVRTKTYPLLDLEAIRVISETPKLRPATQKGKAVRMSFTQPINLKLN
ncbi:energy transducer TonB [Croceimicrobium hydrocarbonivorans]|uniref:Energy transducer TonB n=1 Tax=Croceimicrobium hydrocarbonivorans TaxID=2761580 RepID=A0A7H0VBG4_9FLAO|nr:energy transducer TonB [Croceimicrobium hydrocarbonivorans]QNR23062.1 energy transducer TonB [Croceimicrobium hydrocarbonivorans]